MSQRASMSHPTLESLYGFITGEDDEESVCDAIPAEACTDVPRNFFLLRATWAAAHPRPIANIKRFGFTEIGVEAMSSAWIVVSYC